MKNKLFFTLSPWERGGVRVAGGARISEDKGKSVMILYSDTFYSWIHGLPQRFDFVRLLSVDGQKQMYDDTVKH